MGIPPENLNNKHTNMKKIMIFSAIFAVAISLSACSNNETDISYASAETITLSSTTLNFENAGGTQTAVVFLSIERRSLSLAIESFSSHSIVITAIY